MEVNKSTSIPSTYNVASKKVVDESESEVVRYQGVESDEDEVEMPHDEMSRYIASTGGGGFLKDDLYFYDGYEDRVIRGIGTEKGKKWPKIVPTLIYLVEPTSKKRRRRKGEEEKEEQLFCLLRYVLWKPSRDFTCPLGPLSGLKGLLHTLNATMIPTKSFLQLYRHGYAVSSLMDTAYWSSEQ
ncbi:hypothetical protein Tco_0151454 [Tanacetum coccineum]